jgi:O-antigen/teichoic acid export membrane protein
VWAFQLPLGCAAALILAFASGRAASLFADHSLGLALQLTAIELVLRAGLLEPGWCLLNGSHYHRTQAGLMLMHSVLRVLCVGVSVAGGGSLSGCIVASVVASLLSLALLIPVMMVVCRNESVWQRSKANAATGAELLRWIRWAPLAEVLNYFVVASYLWLLKVISRDPVEIGVYAACFMLAQAVLPLGIAVSRGTFATFASLLDRGCIDEVVVLLRLVLRSVFIAASCMVAVSFVLGPSLMLVFFGSDYGQVGGLLGMLMTGIVGIAIVWVLGDVLNAAGQLPARLTAMLGLGLFAVASGLLLIPAFGTVGGAWAMLLTGAVGALSMGCVVGFRIPGCIPRGTLVRSAVSAAISYVACAAFASASHVGGILVGTVSVVAVNLLCLLLLREWSLGELGSTASAGWDRLTRVMRQPARHRHFDSVSEK